MSENTQSADGFGVTERAARRILSILHDEPQGSMLRVSVSGGGCSGFQYGFTVDQQRNNDELLHRLNLVSFITFLLVQRANLIQSKSIDFSEAWISELQWTLSLLAKPTST